VKVNVIKILFLVVAATPAMAQLAMNDVFDRPDSNSLGADWTQQDGNAKIANNMLLANSPFTFGWCSHNFYSGNYANTVVRARWAMSSAGGDRISLIAGVNPMDWSGIEVRIADNDGDGLADRIFFNAAVNAGAWYTPTSFANMTAPLASGEATLWFSNAGDTVNVALRDLATNAVQSYSASGILAGPPLGGNVGIGYFGHGTVDDFRVWAGSPVGPVYTITATRVGSSPTMLVTDALPFGHVLLGYSLVGAGPIYTPLGVVGLSEPISIFWDASADANGRLELPLGPLGGQVGAMVYTQAVDLSQPALSNAHTVTLL
jgi:hypothetical protein